MRNKTNIAHVALFFAALIYGGNYVIARDAMGVHIPPYAFIVLRVGFGTLAFWLFATLFFKKSPDLNLKRDYKLLIECALAGVVFNQIFFFKGLSLTGPISASLIMTLSPVMVLIFSMIVLRFVPPLKRWIGIAIAGIAALMLILEKVDGINSVSDSSGNFYVFLNATSYAWYLVRVKSLMEKYHPVQVFKWLFLIGFFPVLLWGTPQLASIEWVNIPAYVYAEIAYVLVGTTFLAYLFNAYALQYLRSSVVGTYMYLQPLFASIIAIIIGMDQLSLSKIILGSCILLGVTLAAQKVKVPKNER